MPTFPTGIPAYTNPTENDDLDDEVGSLTHPEMHAAENDDIEGLATKIGTGASTPTSGTVLRGTGAGTSAWGAVVDADVSASAELAVSKLADGAALALLRTDAAGTGVEWGTPGQIAFPATQAASADANTLDDYEEGTWTPALQGLTLAGTWTYTSRTGRYCKIGRNVFCVLDIDINTVSGQTGTLFLSGFPFAQGDQVHRIPLGWWSLIDLTAGYSFLCFGMSSGGATFYQSGDNIGVAGILATALTNATKIAVNFFYDV